MSKMQNLSTAVWMVQSSFLFAPPIFMRLFFYCKRGHPEYLPIVMRVCLMFCLAVVAANIERVHFAAPMANIAMFCLAYCCFCFLISMCSYLKNAIVRVALVVVLAVPIFVGYVLATVGRFGLGLIVAEHVYPPKQVERFDGNLICRINAWGMVLSASGYTVQLSKFWSVAPFIERTVEEISITEIPEGPGPTSANCMDVLNVYVDKRKARA